MDERRVTGETAPLRGWERGVARGENPVLGLGAAGVVFMVGVCGRFLYAEAGMTGGPMCPAGCEVGKAGDFRAAAAMTSLWSAGRGGSDAPRERILEEVLERLLSRCCSFELRLLGDAGGDKVFSTSAFTIVPEYRWFLAISNRSICSAETIVWVPSSAIEISGCFNCPSSGTD